MTAARHVSLMIDEYHNTDARPLLAGIREELGIAADPPSGEILET